MTLSHVFAGVLVATVAAAGATPSPAPQQTTFRSSSDIVRVDALVTDGQRVVQGLRAEDFELRDNGVLQHVSLISTGELALNVVLVLDLSESVKGDRLAQLQAAGRALIDGLSVKDRASLVTFSDVVGAGPLLTQDLSAVRDAIGRVRPQGGTALYDAVHTGIILGNVGAERSLVVLFSDGTDTTSFLSGASAIEAARRGDVVVCGVIAGGSRRFVRTLAEETGGTVMSAESPDRLPGYFARILAEFRQRYLLGYAPAGVATGGWHRIDLRVKGRRLTVNARSGYQS
jgi:VWFA-related protein